MTSFRIERPQSDYTQVCNAILRDKRVSLRAKGLYALMYSKPADWIFYEAALVAESTEGRDAVRTAMRELMQFNWMSKQQPRSDGKFSGNVYRLHVTADWKSGDGSTDDGKSAPTKTDVKKKEEVTLCARFEEFYSAYPNKVARKQCEAIWVRLKLDVHADAILAMLKRWKACEQWQTPQFIPHPSTFLNQERWKSEPPAAEAKKGEFKVRAVPPEQSAREKREAAEMQEFFRLSKLPENNRKSESEIWRMVEQKESVMA